MGTTIFVIIDAVINVLTLLVIAKVILSYFMSPYHPVRETIDRVVEPMMAPVRRIVPPMGMMDFTPFIFIILLRLIRMVLFSLFAAIF
jgi:YggT family protein